jgi:hypothetical protein
MAIEKRQANEIVRWIADYGLINLRGRPRWQSPQIQMLGPSGMEDRSCFASHS